MFIYFIYLFLNFFQFTLSLNINYVLVIDGGSTGSRGFIFRFDNNNNINVTKGKKITPGISSFIDHPEDLWSYFSPVFDDAITIVPKEYHSTTQVFILGTAGMRLLSDDQQEFLWEKLYQGLNRPSFPFQLVKENLKTIDGKLEAYYAVIASNFILGNIGIDLIPNGGMVGALDMGGSSTQLVFHTGTNPKERIEPDHFWSHSWLSFGAEKIQERVWLSLIEKSQLSNTQNDILYNPCMFKGFQTQYYLDTSTNTISTIEGSNNSNSIVMEGTGEPLKCRDIIRQTLWPEGCPSGGPCPVDNIQHPPVDGAFFGISVYFFAFDCVRHYGNKDLIHWPNPSIDELEDASISFCSIPWNDIYTSHQTNSHEMTSDEKLPNRCVEALYITTLLEDGFGFRGTHRGITLALEVDGTEVEWTLGFALAEGSAQTNQISSSSTSSLSKENQKIEEINNKKDSVSSENDSNSDLNENNSLSINDEDTNEVQEEEEEEVAEEKDGKNNQSKFVIARNLIQKSILPYGIKVREVLKQRVLFLVKSLSSISVLSQLLSKSFQVFSLRFQSVTNILIIQPFKKFLQNLFLLNQKIQERVQKVQVKAFQIFQSIKNFKPTLPQYLQRNSTKSK